MKELIKHGTVLINYLSKARTWDFLGLDVAYLLFFSNP
jgi:hypothetical protein